MDVSAIEVKYLLLLHIMCGYQCDKAVNKMIPVK